MMLLAKVSIDHPLLVALAVIVYVAGWVLAFVHMRYASGWQLLSEFFSDGFDRSEGESITVSMSRSSKSSCGVPCRVLLDVRNGYLCLQARMMAGFYFKPLRIPLSRLQPTHSMMWEKGYRLETGEAGTSVLFLFDEEFKKRLASAIDGVTNNPG